MMGLAVLKIFFCFKPAPRLMMRSTILSMEMITETRRRPATTTTTTRRRATSCVTMHLTSIRAVV